MNKTYIIGEIGINHQGDLSIAKRLIDIAAAAGCDAVKFQKRNPDVCVPEHQKNQPRKWQGEDGADRYTTEVNVDEFTFLSTKKESGSSFQDDSSANIQKEVNDSPEDDLPF